MTRDSSSKGTAKGFTIDLPEGVKKSLPKDFDLGSIGNIDLLEAEAVANENVLFLNENDLIEGLEDFDLIPLKEDVRAAEDVPERGTAAPALVQPAVTTVTRETPVSAGSEEAQESMAAHGEPAVGHRLREEVTDDDRTWISLEELDSIDDEGRKWVPLHAIHEEKRPGEEFAAEDIPEERISGSPEQGDAFGSPAGETEDIEDSMVLSLDDLAADEIQMPATAREPESVITEKKGPVTSPGEEPAFVKDIVAPVQEGYVDINEEYMIWNMPDSEAVIAEPVHKPEERVVIPPAGDREKPIVETEKQSAVEPPRKQVVTIGEPEMTVPVRAKDVPITALKKTGRPSPEEIKPEIRDARQAARAVFIDDRQADGDREDDAGFEETRLDKIISGILQVDEGSSYLLREAGADEDRERIATVADDFQPEFEEMFEDLDYKYGDEEMDYIHTAIVEEDYSSYIREIDEFFGTRGGRTVSARLELMGLTAEEFDSIEDLLFKDEYRDVNLYDRYHLYEFDRGARADVKEDRRYRYLLPAEGSLIDIERDSIENDVSASSALIFEEDVQHIREQLKKRTGKTDVEVVEMVERSFNRSEEKESRRETDVPAVEPVVEKITGEAPIAPQHAWEEDEPAAVKTAADTIRDITDRVVILEDRADVERFVKTFPEQKQVNIKMLLKYLDGLFERLPEEIIRKFASSDYFNLYLKVLNELGV